MSHASLCHPARVWERDNYKVFVSLLIPEINVGFILVVPVINTSAVMMCNCINAIFTIKNPKCFAE